MSIIKESMQKLKVIEWIQLAFMLLVVLNIMSFVVQFAIPYERLTELSNSTNYTCYSILYFDSSSPPYISAICKTPVTFPEILRVSLNNQPTFTSNHLNDIVILIIVVVGGLVSWSLYGLKVLRRYSLWL